MKGSTCPKRSEECSSEDCSSEKKSGDGRGEFRASSKRATRST